jgi:hypothetical protein
LCGPVVEITGKTRAMTGDMLGLFSIKKAPDCLTAGAFAFFCVLKRS